MSKQDERTMEALYEELQSRALAMRLEGLFYPPGSPEMVEFVRRQNARNIPFIQRVHDTVQDIRTRNPAPSAHLERMLQAAQKWYEQEESVRDELEGLLRKATARFGPRPTQPKGEA